MLSCVVRVSALDGFFDILNDHVIAMAINNLNRSLPMVANSLPNAWDSGYCCLNGFFNN